MIIFQQCNVPNDIVLRGYVDNVCINACMCLITMTLSKGNIFRVTGPLDPTHSPVTWSCGVLFDLRLNTRLNKQSRFSDLRRHRTHYDVTVYACMCMCVCVRMSDGCTQPNITLLTKYQPPTHPRRTILVQILNPFDIQPYVKITLQWRHNRCNDVSNQRCLGC